jgi:hypothetical protein
VSGTVSRELFGLHGPLAQPPRSSGPESAPPEGRWASGPLPLADAWATYLSPIPWDWFVTLTFDWNRKRNLVYQDSWETALTGEKDWRHAVGADGKPIRIQAGWHPEKEDKLYRLWINKLNTKLFGRRWYRRHWQGVLWVRATEKHRSGKHHFHALVAAPQLEDERRLAWMDSWNELAGFARIYPPKQQEAVVAYCAKYVSKDGELELGGPWGLWRTLQPPEARNGDSGSGSRADGA